MASNWNIRWPKDLMQEAVDQGKHLLALGHQCGIRVEFFMFKTEDEIYILQGLAHEMHDGSDPREALEKVLANLAAAKQRLAERKAAREAAAATN